MLQVEGRKGQAAGPAAPGASAEQPIVGEEAVEPAIREAPSAPLAEIFPPGPLAEVRITPSALRVECGGRRHARAEPLDAAGRALTESVTFSWELSWPVGRLEAAGPDPARVLVLAAAEPGGGKLSVIARCDGREASAEATVEVVEELPEGRSEEGIPEPELVDQPGSRWRSRIVDGRWQVNAGHPEYREIAGQPALKLRYLAMLFAKEVVLTSSQDPRLESPLEQMVEVAAYADRRLAERRPGKLRGRARPSRKGDAT